jgi:putative alpha-1,2-mannosidase
LPAVRHGPTQPGYEDRRRLRLRLPLWAYCTGKQFTIIARNQGPRNIYSQSARLSGQPLTGCWFYHEDLAKGGTLEIALGATPNKAWGLNPPPPSGVLILSCRLKAGIRLQRSDQE